MSDHLITNYSKQMENYQEVKIEEQMNDDKLVEKSCKDKFDELYIDVQNRDDTDFWLKLRHEIFNSESVQKWTKKATYSINLMLFEIAIPCAYLIYQIFFYNLTFDDFTHRMKAILYFIMFWSVPVFLRFNQAADLQIKAREFLHQFKVLQNLLKENPHLKI